MRNREPSPWDADFEPHVPGSDLYVPEYEACLEGVQVAQIPLEYLVAGEVLAGLRDETDDLPDGITWPQVLDTVAELHWNSCVNSIDPVAGPPYEELHSVNDPARHLAIRLHCPACGKKLAYFGIDSERINTRSDRVWYRTYRRVKPTFNGIFDTYEEGRYQAFTRINLHCPVPGCRGNPEYRLDTIVETLHRMRDELPSGTRVDWP